MSSMKKTLPKQGFSQPELILSLETSTPSISKKKDSFSYSSRLIDKKVDETVQTAHLKKWLDCLLEEELKLNAISCSLIFVGLFRGLNPLQQSDFFIPWGKAPESKEEEAFQDLVYIHRVLPPNEKFNSHLAEKGFYTKLRWRKQDEFWSNYDPDQDTEIKSRNTYKASSYTTKNKSLKHFKSTNKGLRPSRPTRRKSHAI